MTMKETKEKKIRRKERERKGRKEKEKRRKDLAKPQLRLCKKLWLSLKKGGKTEERGGGTDKAA